MANRGEVRSSRIGLRRAGTALAALAALGLAVISVPAAKGQSFSVLYSFKGSPDGAAPYAGVIMDKAGNLYGTTEVGGVSNGTVFKLDSSGNETLLHSFTNSPDGSGPFAALIMDTAGNLYGTTYYGGVCCGIVFKLDTSSNETVLHSFTGGSDGGGPLAGLIMDAAGNLYGTTFGGGAFGNGTVFKLDPSGNETVLYSFTGGSDGSFPSAALIMDAIGNLYGTTAGGGSAGSACTLACGTVFKLDTSGNETVLHSFTGGTDGSDPTAGLIMDAAGNLYGTTFTGGLGGIYGTVFKLDSSGNETVLHRFTGGSDGASPAGALVMDAAGNLYGTTSDLNVQTAGHNGTVFKLDPSGNETVLYSFTGGSDGKYPFYGSLVMDTAGNLYGTTSGGALSATGRCSNLLSRRRSRRPNPSSTP